jgi:hypothetical protein
MNKHIEDGIERLRTEWPQSHHERNEHGYHLIVVPGVALPKGWDKTTCTVLFLAPPGYPAARPDHFFTDVEVRLADKSWPHWTNMGNGALLGRLGWPQWKDCQWWSWHLQMWSPNHGSLFTYMKVIQQRLSPAR